MNEQIQTLIENLEDSRKRVRQKAVENVIKLIQQNDVHTNQLKNALLGNNLDLTSSVIQIMCRSGAEETKTLLYWLKEYRDVHNPLLNEYEWSHNEERGVRIYRSIKKYVRQNLRFQDLFTFLQELYVESVEIRRNLISQIRTHYPDLVESLHLYFVVERVANWRSITEETYKKGEQLELESDVSFIHHLPIELKESHVYKLYFYQFWLDLLKELSFDFVYDEESKPIFSLEEMLTLQENSTLDLICCPNSRFRLHVSSVLEELPHSNYMILNSFECISKEWLWDKINSSRNWYKNTSLNDYSNHMASKALQALLVLGDVEALDLFKEVCEYYDSHENGIPSDASRIYTRFSQTVQSEEDLNFDPNIEIGNRWEEICVKLAEHLYGNILVHPQLPNGFIPDIAVNQGLRFQEGKLAQAEIFIECKKSDKFLFEEHPPNRMQPVTEVNNAVTAKYKPYCERLEFWLFEDHGFIKRSHHRDVVVRYASDFLNDPSIPEVIKNEINELTMYGNKLFEEMDRIAAEDPISQAQSRIYELYQKHLQKMSS